MFITLQWDANQEPDLDHYVVFWGTSLGSYSDNSGNIDKSETTYTVTGLSGGTTYYLAVKAYDDQGRESNYSNEAATCSVAAPIVIGETPINDITPTWAWSSGEGEGSGTFRYKLDNSDLTFNATETTDTSYRANTALSEESHTLYVQEQDNEGRWSSSGSFTIVIDTTEPTSSATALNYGSGTFSITWAASDKTSGVASTESWYKGPGGTWANTRLDAQTGTSGTFSYTPIEGEEAEEGTYYFATRSTDNAGNAEEEPSGEGDLSFTFEETTTTHPPSDNGGCFIAAAAF